ncbi:hypothetical protein BJV78DRAFT_1225985 [Lactifluus subvellereus]|nr:hypothetical protein BJV78DRAFT_1225985 [Lactifluus subvellereus]
MIIDIPTAPMPNGAPVPTENPPAYESAIYGTNTVPLPQKTAAPRDTQPNGTPLMSAGGPQVVYGATASEPTVYYYEDPRTGQRVASLLPPDHPQMVCLQAGAHVPETRYGCLGLFAAIVWFPLGIALCLLDRRVRCERCGESIEEGLCS